MFRFEFILFLVLCLFKFNQLKSQSNIDPGNSLLSRKEFYFLKTTNFQNGDQILVIRDISEWQNTRKKSNIPAVFIDEYDNYLYNYYALTDKRGLIPDSVSIPTINFLKEFELSLSNEQNIKGVHHSSTDLNILFFNKQPIIEPNDGVDDRFYYFPSSNLFYTWAYQDEFNSSEYSAAYNFKLNGYDNDVVLSTSIYKSSALPILVCQTLNQMLSTSHYVWEYDELMEGKMNEINSFFKSYSLRIANSINKNIKYYSYSSNLLFNNNGVKKLDDVISFKDNYKIGKRINDLIIREIDSVYINPVFNNNYLNSRKEIYIQFSSWIKRISLDVNKDDYNYLKYYLRDISVSEEDIRFINRSGFIYKGNICHVKGYIGDDNFYNEKLFVRKVRGPGFVNLPLSIFPGLGVTSIRRKSIYKRYKPIYKTSFLLSSALLATSAYISKKKSNEYYDSYRKTLSTEIASDYYDKANLYNKVFFSSVGLYSLLAVIDFSFTYRIAYKNKSVQRSINKKIKNSNSLY